MIKEFEIYHGVVFSRLFNASPTAICAASYPSSSNASYFLKNSDRAAGMYIKHCSKRLSPWRFTFLEEHQGEINKMKAEFGEVFVVLVCGKNGIVVLNYAELKSILDHNHDPAEWISVARGKRQMYTVKGKDGALDFKVTSRARFWIISVLKPCQRRANSRITSVFMRLLRVPSLGSGR